MVAAPMATELAPAVTTAVGPVLVDEVDVIETPVPADTRLLLELLVAGLEVALLLADLDETLPEPVVVALLVGAVEVALPEPVVLLAVEVEVCEAGQTVV
jgi:hypothetical protein